MHTLVYTHKLTGLGSRQADRNYSITQREPEICFQASQYEISYIVLQLFIIILQKELPDKII